jgi:tetratricopeptide (TPR) repeat protein
LSFLLEEGALHIDADRVNFDAASMGSVLPASMQSLLASRVDRLSIEDRALLQVAAAIGLRFDVDLLSLVFENKDEAGAALRRLETQELIYREASASDYVFKHTMLRETVYQSMVSDRKEDLHLAIAQALEKRYEDRLAEKADTLAYHYARTDQNDLAFTYAVLAANKSMGIFALDEANQYFESAFDIYERDPNCASKKDFTVFIADYALCLNISLHVETLISFADKVRPIFIELGDTRHHALFLHHYTQCLVWNGRYKEAHAIRQELTEVADRLGDPISLAYAQLSEISVSNFFGAMPSEDYDALSMKIEAALETFDDPYLRNFFLATVGWNEITRGRVAKANLTADRILEMGISRNDPRSLGYGKAQKALIAMLGDDQERALDFSEQALSVSRTEYDTASAAASIHSALIQLDRPGAMEKAQAHIDMCVEKGWTLFIAGPEVMLGVGLAMQGRIKEGLKHIEAAIEHRDAEGYESAADWYRLSLCEIYLAVLSGEGEASAGMLLRNAGTLSKVILFGPKRIFSLVERIRANPQFDSEGHYIARCELIVGMLYKIKKKTALAKHHLTEAQRIVKPSGPSPMLTRIETALEELQSV